MVIANNGNVGIGTINPTFKLDVAGTANITGAVTCGGTLAATGNVTIGGYTLGTNGTWSGNSETATTSGACSGTALNATTAYGLTGSPNVSVGTVTATGIVSCSSLNTNGGGIAAGAGAIGCGSVAATGTITAPDISVETVTATSARFAGSAGPGADFEGMFFDGESSTLQSFASNLPLSIYAERYILSKQGFMASSDRRIKQNITTVSTNLNMIDVIDVVSYQYIDKVFNGNKTKIGYIAQEIHKVLPDAVTKRVDWVADIFQIASHVDPETKQITLLNHNLIVGTTIKLVNISGKSNGFSAQVSKVIDADTFSVRCNESLDSQVFVYGRNVDDFHDLDYDMLSAVAFGGVKELHVKHKEQCSHIITLESRVSALEELINKMISQSK
jgi:hypothetical protein